MNVFDATLTVCSIIALFARLFTTQSSRNVIFGLLRVLRVSRILLHFKEFRTTYLTFIKILPAASSLLLNLFTITYVFASIGMQAWGGLINLVRRTYLSSPSLYLPFRVVSHWRWHSDGTVPVIVSRTPPSPSSPSSTPPTGLWMAIM